MLSLYVLNGRILDVYDQKILDALKNNSRTKYTNIAKNLNISEGMVRQRVKSLIKNEVITKFTIESKL